MRSTTGHVGGWPALLVVAVASACVDHAPASPHTRIAKLGLHTQVLAARASTLAIAVAYHAGSTLVPLAVTPASVAVAAGANTIPVEFDAGPCLADARAGRNGVSGCFLQVELELIDDAGLLDRRIVQAPTAVSGGAVVDLPSLTLGGVGQVQLSVSSATLRSGDSVTIVATPRTSAGRALTRPVTFSSSDALIAEVNSAGRVRALGLGSANVTATSDDVTAAAAVTVRPWTTAEANGMRTVVLQGLSQTSAGFVTAPGGAEGISLLGGLLADEWRSGDTFVERDETDRRNVSADNQLWRRRSAR
jgi:hypothetical protein